MSIKNAIIESASIDDADRGMLTAWVHVDYGGSGQGFGGYALYLPRAFKHHKIESHAGHFIWRVMEIAGVTRWKDLPGKAVRVDHDRGEIKGLGHITKNDWFYPAEDFGDA
jgi:hypothetical protein